MAEVADNRKEPARTGRAPDGRFTSGNPGRPRGTRTKATQAAEVLLQGEATALTRKAVELALEGDTTALRLCLERIVPPRKDGPIEFDLPEMKTAEDAARAMGAIVESVSSGSLTPSEGAAVAGLVDAFRRTLETEELERRVDRLERRSER